MPKPMPNIERSVLRDATNQECFNLYRGGDQEENEQKSAASELLVRPVVSADAATLDHNQMMGIPS